MHNPLHAFARRRVSTRLNIGFIGESGKWIFSSESPNRKIELAGARDSPFFPKQIRKISPTCGIVRQFYA